MLMCTQSNSQQKGVLEMVSTEKCPSCGGDMEFGYSFLRFSLLSAAELGFPEQYELNDRLKEE